MDTTKDIKKDLKHVIVRNIDAKKGYEKAADKVRNPSLENAFRQQATQRFEFASELENNANVFGSRDLRNLDLDDSSFKGDMHRTWMDVKTAFSSDKDEAIVEECIRGEKAALEDYNELLRDNAIASPAREAITRQRDTVQQCINELTTLERQLD